MSLTCGYLSANIFMPLPTNLTACLLTREKASFKIFSALPTMLTITCLTSWKAGFKTEVTMQRNGPRPGDFDKSSTYSHIWSTVVSTHLPLQTSASDIFEFEAMIFLIVAIPFVRHFLTMASRSLRDPCTYTFKSSLTRASGLFWLDDMILKIVLSLYLSSREFCTHLRIVRKFLKASKADVMVSWGRPTAFMTPASPPFTSSATLPTCFLMCDAAFLTWCFTPFTALWMWFFTLLAVLLIHREMDPHRCRALLVMLARPSAA
mmetsp:Transcript_49709/g.115297  ORF Transcript_49709/g.115297 Transcript_49709/m.115297 type:complete len:263 (+) Transcript_49709:1275-2063(+)